MEGETGERQALENSGAFGASCLGVYAFLPKKVTVLQSRSLDISRFSFVLLLEFKQKGI